MTKLLLRVVLSSVVLVVSTQSFANSEDAYAYSNASAAAAETNLCGTTPNTYTLMDNPNDTASLLLANLCSATNTMAANLSASQSAMASTTGTAKTNAQAALGGVSYS